MDLLFLHKNNQIFSNLIPFSKFATNNGFPKLGEFFTMTLVAPGHGYAESAAAAYYMKALTTIFDKDLNFHGSRIIPFG